MANRLARYGSLIKESTRLFLDNDPLRMAGATAFFTIFALPPILIIIVQVLGIFIDPQTLRHELFINLSEIFGREAVRQLVGIIRAVKDLNDNRVAAVLLFIFLLFVATTVFRVVRSSVNQLWKVDKPADEKLVRSLSSRLLSLGIILVTGVLFSAGIFIEAMQVVIGNYFFSIFPSLSGFINATLSTLISLSIIAAWFTIIFRYLNDARPSWKVAIAGGLFTSILFSIGKAVLHLLLTYSKVNTIYGASAAMVLLLLFVFYGAMILYFGAAFTKIWGSRKVV